jgi:RNA polymerase sigma-70 factor (ECF subfamily)
LDRTDLDLAREIASGSARAFERLVERYGRLVHRVARGFTGDREAAMEVSQETFVKIHGRIAGWRGEGSLAGWIARIAAHEALNWERGRRARPTAPFDESIFLLPDPTEDEAQEIERLDARRSIRRALAGLPPRPRLAIVLRYFEGLSAREIGAALGCSEETARNLLFRSLRTLRSRMEEALR